MKSVRTKNATVLNVFQNLHRVADYCLRAALTVLAISIWTVMGPAPP